MITPQRYGARGDGRADDTAALRRAVAAHKIVEIPPGSYRLTGPLRLRSGSALIGPGTLIVDFDSGKMDASNAAISAQGADVRIEGVTLAKRFRDGSYGVGVLIESGSRNITLRNLEIHGYSARYGIHIVESENFEIGGCVVRDFLMDTIADMILDSPAGIRITRSRNGIISGNRVLRIEVGLRGYASVSPVRPAYGRQTYQSDHLTVMQCRSVAIVGNVLDTSGEGIDLLLSQECTVSANTIGNIWFQGIKMLGARFCSVTGNVIRDCLQGIGLTEHAAMKTDCVGNTVTGNTILNPGAPGVFRVPVGERAGIGGAFGIEITGRCRNNVVSHNVVLDTQAKKTMALPIHQEPTQHNRVENNETGD